MQQLKNINQTDKTSNKINQIMINFNNSITPTKNSLPKENTNKINKMSAKVTLHGSIYPSSPKNTLVKNTVTYSQKFVTHLKRLELNLEVQESPQKFLPTRRFLTISPTSSQHQVNPQLSNKIKTFIKNVKSHKIRQHLNQTQLHTPKPPQPLKTQRTQTTHQNPQKISPYKYRNNNMPTIDDLLQWKKQQCNTLLEEKKQKQSQSLNKTQRKHKNKTQKLFPIGNGNIRTKKNLKSDQFYIKLKLKKTLHQNFLIKNKGAKARNHEDIRLEVEHREVSLCKRIGLGRKCQGEEIKEQKLQMNLSTRIQQLQKNIGSSQSPSNALVRVYSINKCKKYKTQHRSPNHSPSNNNTLLPKNSSQSQQKPNNLHQLLDTYIKPQQNINRFPLISPTKKAYKSNKKYDLDFREQNFRPWSPVEQY